MRFGTAARFGLAAWLWSALLCAQPVDDATRGAARKLGYSGVTAFQAGQYAAASEKLEKAYRVLRAPSLGLWSARALVQLGRLVEASERYLEVTRLDSSGGDAAVQKQAQVDAQRELDALAPRVPSIVVTIDGASAADVAVTIDGVTVAAALIGESRPTDPGRHVVVGQRGAEHVRVDVTVVEGKQAAAVLRFGPGVVAADAKSGPVTEAAAPSSTADRSGDGSTQRTLGWVSLGVGAAGLVVGGVSGILAIGKRNSLEGDERCRADECLPGAKDEVDALGTLRTISTLGFIGGGVLAATGITLVLTAPSSPRVALRFGPGVAQLEGRFQ